MNLVVDLQYFSCIIYYKILSKFEDIYFPLYEPYRKMSFRNRCLIPGGNGIIDLSVPLLKGRNQRIPYAEVLIDNTQKWQVQHWRSIISAYNRSPWFEHYKPSLEQLYMKEYVYLYEWNRATMEWVLRQLKLNLKLNYMKDNDHVMPPESDDYSDKWLPKNYADASVVGAVPSYLQVFEERHGFQPNLSILDLIFCTGPAAREILTAG